MADPRIDGLGLHLVRQALVRDTAPVWVPDRDMDQVAAWLAVLTANLLRDLAYATGTDPADLLHAAEFASLSRTI